MEKILGIDLGTNSIGLSVRNPELGSTLPEQLEYYCSYIFSSGVGKEKGNEYSYASQRTKFRSQRHLHRTRRYRLWRTLEVLIESGCCPLSIDDLDKWRICDKSKGLHREYPIHNLQFEQWIRLDFNGDGIPDYSSPFQLREELATIQLDLTDSINRYKLGRGIYHIAQHRGFKSSKGETIQSQEAEDRGESDTLAELKRSEIEKSKGLTVYMREHSCPTVGCAFAQLERERIRIRANSTYQAVRSMHAEEIRHIFEFQHQLDLNSTFYRQLVSRAKGEGSIFYKQPLRSQKGNVGKCTLEPTKSRCPISRPEFEFFRAWSVLNNIKYKSDSGEWLSLPLHEREMIFNELFFLSKSNITMEDIQKKILQKTNLQIQELNYPLKTKLKTCPVARCLRNLLGAQWQTDTLNGYNYEELWHICYEADELDDVHDFVAKYLNNDEETNKWMERLWGCVGQGYAMLSLKAINLINKFLLKGYIYSDAVLLAKLPDIFGEEQWQECERVVLNDFECIKLTNKKKQTIAKITNNLIAAYKAQNTDETFAYKDYSYTLDASDKKDVRAFCVDTLSKACWDELSHDEQDNLVHEVATAYQAFFQNIHREYIPVPKLTDSLQEYILDNFSSVLDDHACKKLKYLYHPSNISIYKPAKSQEIVVNGHKLSKRLLGSPDVGVFKNPVAMRALYVLRKHINELIANGIIDEDYTRVVVELARDMNDANMRKAIEIYQNKREDENKEIARLITEYYPDRQITADDVYKVRLMFEQPSDRMSLSKVTADKDEKLTYKDAQFQKFVTKYTLLKEQNFQCLYTGKMINMANLFSDDKFEIEHTIPRSISFDDSLANQTICDVSYNRNIKKNRIPSQLAEYEQIKLRIQPWINKVKMLQERVRFWKDAAKFATTKDTKDARIQQMHAWKMELDYWERKVNSFMVEADALNLGFRNRQLVDTRVISKYGYHFLRSVFSHVDVQRGETTAVFRKVLGIQSMDEKKDRSKHSHHAVDATILTLIPPANRRDAMLKLYYDIQEAEKGLNGLSVERLKQQLQNEVAICSIKGTSKVVPLIEENILINHIAQDKALTPARRKERIHGKVVRFLDENGKLTPKVINTGDSLRGNIHLQSWYGAIQLPISDTEGKPMRDEQGNFIYDPKQPILYVKRKSLDELANGTNKLDWNKLENVMVDKHLFRMMRSQYPNLSFKDACREGLFMLDKQGNHVNQIRHVRCYAPSNAHIVPIKEQTYQSAKSYKQDFLADVGDMYAMARYENEKGKSTYRTYSLYEISKSGLMEIPTQYVEKDCVWKLVHVLKKGMKLLLFEHDRDELTSMSNAQYSKRLYIIQGFESDKRITLLHHLCAKPDAPREPIKTFEVLPEKIRCSINQINYLVEEIDFEQTVKGIEVK